MRSTGGSDNNTTTSKGSGNSRNNNANDIKTTIGLMSRRNNNRRDDVSLATPVIRSARTVSSGVNSRKVTPRVNNTSNYKTTRAMRRNRSNRSLRSSRTRSNNSNNATAMEFHNLIRPFRGRSGAGGAGLQQGVHSAGRVRSTATKNSSSQQAGNHDGADIMPDAKKRFSTNTASSTKSGAIGNHSNRSNRSNRKGLLSFIFRHQNRNDKISKLEKKDSAVGVDCLDDIQLITTASSITTFAQLSHTQSQAYRLENTKILVNNVDEDVISGDDVFDGLDIQPSTSSTCSSSSSSGDRENDQNATNKYQKLTTKDKDDKNNKDTLGTTGTCDCTGTMFNELLCGSKNHVLPTIPEGAVEDNFGDVEQLENLVKQRTNQLLEQRRRNKDTMFPEDPTAQESIECVFAHQALDQLALYSSSSSSSDDSESSSNDNKDSIEKSASSKDFDDFELKSPAALMQSIAKPREYGPKQSHMISSQSDRCLGCIVDTTDTLRYRNETLVSQLTPGSYAPMHSSCPICNGKKATPTLPSNKWPQYPLLLRAKPNCGMVIRGVRFSKSKTYIWSAKRDQNTTWVQKLEEWRSEQQQIISGQPHSQHSHEQDTAAKSTAPCSQCMMLPINNGNEPTGDALVIDFETKLFQGTFMVRLRYSKSVAVSSDENSRGKQGKKEEIFQEYEDNVGYFNGLNRRYQVLIRGRFKQQISMTQCISGFVYDRPCGRLPPKFLLKGALKVVSFFAPQLQTRLDGPKPTTMAPLGSTPQAIMVVPKEEDNGFFDNDNDDYMAIYLDDHDNIYEPINIGHTLLGEDYPSNIGREAALVESTEGSLQRSRFRKKEFDKLYCKSSPFPQTDTSKIYTFEFLQHLINFQDLALDLGSFMGNVSLRDTLDGNPIQIMAAAASSMSVIQKQLQNTQSSVLSLSSSSTAGNLNPLWAFEVWHSDLIKDSKRHDDARDDGTED